ncbi:MAG: glutamine--fructose-6-phosphate aminotransferase [isomerizing] [Candidatus Tectimicrobiota bacterium]|nr:MAG: glutamine--fructose-6-phosphate aminotransferase [isomerizing] [Candidatus Tectomicrobia bacterium]
MGIGHTRWATHGKPSEENAHPHANASGTLMLVHNGIIENYQTLRHQLAARGYTFSSETDTEVVAHLIDAEYDGDLVQAVKRALRKVSGTFGLVVMHARHPEQLVAARRGSPMVLGVGNGEMLVASDVAAFLRLTDKVVYLEDDDVVSITRQEFVIDTLADERVERQAQQIEWQPDAVELNGYPHYMLKEIFEQPEAITNALRGRLLPGEGIANLGGLRSVLDRLKEAHHLVIVSCGTSYYAGLYGRYVFEKLTDLIVEVEVASEMRYRKTNIRPGSVVLAISQSGETADTIAAMREAGRKGALLLGLVNVVGSTISRITEAGVYNHAGPEIGVASTKIFTSQCCILVMMALLLGRCKHLSITDGMEIVAGLERLPEQIAAVLKQADYIRTIAEAYARYRNFLFIGRKYNYPIALEGALKLKEISYVHAEGCAAGEMKHGFIAMIDENFPTVCLATKDTTYEKTLSNMLEIKSRNGKIIAVATEGDEEIAHIADHVIYTPPNLDFLQPIPAAVALQLFAYYSAVARGCEIDQPRNLAKSVTVE